MNTRRKFSKDFKLFILRKLELKTAAEVCRAHSLRPKMVERWKSEYNKDPERAFRGGGTRWKEKAEIDYYQRLVGKLYAELDFLKKTLEVMQRRRAEERMRNLK